MLIAGGVLAATVLVLGLAVPILQKQSKKIAKPIEFSNEGEIHINVSMDEVNHEEVRIVIPEQDTTAESEYYDVKIRNLFNEAEL
jgi:hypothetical protein